MPIRSSWTVVIASSSNLKKPVPCFFQFSLRTRNNWSSAAYAILCPRIRHSVPTFTSCVPTGFGLPFPCPYSPGIAWWQVPSSSVLDEPQPTLCQTWTSFRPLVMPSVSLHIWTRAHCVSKAVHLSLVGAGVWTACIVYGFLSFRLPSQPSSLYNVPLVFKHIVLICRFFPTHPAFPASVVWPFVWTLGWLCLVHSPPLQF